jgi:phage-related protein
LFELIFYETEKGQIPVEDFLKDLPLKLRAKISRDLMILQDRGNTLREPYSKHISDGLFELRTKFGSDITRVFYFFIVDNKIILTNGFVKKTQKTPQKEIKKALEYKQDYNRRYFK